MLGLKVLCRHMLQSSTAREERMAGRLSLCSQPLPGSGWAAEVVPSQLSDPTFLLQRFYPLHGECAALVTMSNSALRVDNRMSGMSFFALSSLAAHVEIPMGGTEMIYRGEVPMRETDER